MGVNRIWRAPAISMAAALAVAAPAAARPTSTRTPTQTNVTLTGALTLAWASDPARGCAAAGLCGVSGSIEMLPGGSESSSGGGGPGPPSPFPLQVSDYNAIARVIDRAPDGTVVSTCADPVPVDMGLTVRRTAGGLRAVMAGPGFGAPSSGRCAGPTAADLQALALPARRFGAHGYDLSGQTTFDAGPFTITASSTVLAHITYGSQGNGPGFLGAPPPPFNFPAPPTPRRALEEHAQIAYRVVAVRGALAQRFAGAAPPQCDGLGACGTSGTLTETLGPLHTMTFSAARIVSRRIGRAGALADVRSGAMRLQSLPVARPASVSVAETLSEPGGVTCTDRAGVDQVVPVPAAGHRLIRLGLELSFGPAPSTALLRTRCPGPSAAAALSDQSAVLARALVRPRQIGAARLTLTFTGPGGFAGNAYTGRRSGALVVTLVRTRVRGGTRSVETFPGGPPP